MILYDKNLSFDFRQFGVSIPIHPSKAQRTLKELKKDKLLWKKHSSWLIEGISARLDREDLFRVHQKDYILSFFTNQLESKIMEAFELVLPDGSYHRYDPHKAVKPLSELLDRTLQICAGTYQNSLLALEYGFSYFLGGGMHHGHYDFGHGFCLVNDIVLAAKKLQADDNVGHVWIIDVDVHKGDGTAALTKDDPTITTLSVHMAKGWPLDMEQFDAKGNLNPWFIASDIDVPVAEGEEADHNRKLEQALNQLKQNYPKADLAIVVDGSDPFIEDELPSSGKMNLSLEQLLERDTMIYEFLKENRIPASFLMAGGYGKNSWKVYTQFLHPLMKKLYC